MHSIATTSRDLLSNLPVGLYESDVKFGETAQVVLHSAPEWPHVNWRRTNVDGFGSLVHVCLLSSDS